ncbi:MAG: prepilin-type N-terminal cleavage/methylation domain-containing protein [Terriglobia bacterium]
MAFPGNSLSGNSARFRTPINRRTRCRTAFSGFTLLELMIASAIVTIGLLSLLSLMLFAMKMRFDSQLSSTALRLSQQMIEGLKTRAFDDPILIGPGNALGSKGTIDFNSPQDPLATFTQSLTLNKMLHTACTFETRWNISFTGGKKILTVATRKLDSPSASFSPVNLRIILPSE